jgi:RHS repeat-associated protein
MSKTVNPDGIGTGGETKKFGYDGNDLILEMNGQDSIVANYTHGPGVDDPLMMNRAGKNYYYAKDGLGSVTALTDSTGSVVHEYKYSVFGKMVEETGDSVENPFTYTSREYDKETGNYFYRARYYNPQIGKFLSEDPIGFYGEDINLFRYARNNPVNWIDPLGLIWEYNQTTGQLTHIDDQTGERTEAGTGFAGQGEGRNNPDMQGVSNTGPIPQGEYTIGTQQTNTTGTGTRLAASMRLTPDATNDMQGRAGFLIHGGTVSHGCVVTDRTVRDQIG